MGLTRQFAVLTTRRLESSIVRHPMKSLARPARFAVVVVRPAGFLHSAAFDESAEAVHNGLLVLGYDSIRTDRLD